MIAYGRLGDNNMSDLIRLADSYNHNQGLKDLKTQSPDRWDVVLKHVSEQMQSPLTISHLWRPRLMKRKTDSRMKNIASTVWTAVRTRPGTSFFNYLLEKHAQEEEKRILTKDERSIEC